jgi:hypothetical protein
MTGAAGKGRKTVRTVRPQRAGGVFEQLGFVKYSRLDFSRPVRPRLDAVGVPREKRRIPETIVALIRMPHMIM